MMPTFLNLQVIFSFAVFCERGRESNGRAHAARESVRTRG
jgi:hypothetical protein